jgi:acyl-[acyl-carrier-protein]-phospholipid O-acyltransferase/long-chain-fatty-acid--[acyl-carrier-protein] ligase
MFFYGFDQLGERLEKPTPGDPIEALLELAQRYRAFVVQNPSLAALMFSRPFASFDPAPEESAAGARVRTRIVDAVRHAIDAGRITGDPIDIAHAYVSVLRLATMNVLPPLRIELDPALHGHARRKAAGREMQRLLLRLFYSTYDFRRPIVSALAEAARRYGTRRPVLEDINREPLTWRRIFTRAMVLAPLLAKNTRRGEHVGVLLPNSNANVLVFLALQLTGRVPAMLNFTAGPQAILRACDTAAVRTVYTARKFAENAQLQAVMEELAKSLDVVYLEDLRTQVSAFGKLLGLLRSFFPVLQHRLWGGAKPDDPAVVLFTSGSEGSPKGVVLSHANLLSNYAQVRCLIDFRPDDVLFACLPMFHSFGLNGGFLMPLLGGAKVFLYPTPLHYRIIPELIYEMGATILFGTSTFFKGYARYAHPYDLFTLRYTVAGAERLRPETRTQWMEKFGIRILEGYGVTEASPVIAVNTPIAHKAGSVGQILPGMEYYLEPVPGIGEGGRLIVRGPNVMVGYLLPGADGIRPPSTDRGPGWYDTGDIAFVDDEGFIHIRGRARRFAKIGGEMVSLAAVEELALQTWPEYNHAAVAIADEKKGEKIILVSDCPEASRRGIQEKARELRYSELCIPRKVFRAEKLPLLASGKTDYITLSKLLQQEDREDGGWIDRLGRLVTGEREETLPPVPAAGEDPPAGDH